MSDRFCTRCGAAATEAKFCTACGAVLERPDLEDPVGEAGGAREPLSTGEAGGIATAVRSSAEPAASEAAPTLAPDARIGDGGTDKRSWLPYAVCASVIVAALAVAAVALVVLGGKPSHARNLKPESTRLTDVLLATRQLYVPTQQASFSTLLPAGWHQISESNPALGSRVAVRSPVDNGATITVGQVKRPARSLTAEGRALLRTATKLPGFHEDAATAVKLAGGREAWELAYQARGMANAYYLVQSCGQMYAVGANVPRVRVALLRQRIATVAATLQGSC